LRFNDDKFIGYEKFDRDSVDAFQSEKYGIAIKGPKAGRLNYTVDFDILIKGMLTNPNTYWLN